MATTPIISHQIGLAIVAEADSLPERVFVREITHGERLINHRHARGVSEVAVVKAAPLDHGNVHRAKIIRANTAIVSARPFVDGQRRAALNSETGLRAFIQRQRIDRADRGHAWNRADALQGFVVKEM